MRCMGRQAQMVHTAGLTLINKRRVLLAMLGASSLRPRIGWPQRKRVRIGWVDAGAPGSVELKAFLAGLSDFGYVDGPNTVIDCRWAEGRLDRLPAFVAELIALKPDVIVARSFAAIQAAKAATTTVPIVFAAGDPVESGFVSSLAHPGGNLTGLSMNQRDLLPKRLEFLKETLPALSRLSVLINPDDPITKLYSSQRFSDTAQSLGIQLTPVAGGGRADLPGAFTAMAQAKAEAVMVLGGAVFYDQRQRIADLALQNGLPLATEAIQYVEVGGFMSFGIDIPEIYRRTAVYVDKILKGASPSDLPIEQPNRYELAINLATARSLGIVIPPLVLGRADRVIE